MRVAIAGGALQGLEITYLAGKAGYETLLMDRRPDAPASRLCHRFVKADLTDHAALSGALCAAPEPVDMVIPATENARALQNLVAWCEEHGLPLAFDPEAYALSSSKSASDALLRRLGVPAPAPWPECAFPVVAKPDSGSGSHGVQVFPDLEALEARFGTLPPPGQVLQEYVPGPSYSIEVVGRPGEYTPLQATKLEMDRNYDCKRVLAPSALSADMERRLEELVVTLAEAVGLRGIMDVEAILHEDELKVLEIDARFPSQTPIAVYHSTGVNMVERLVKIFSTGREGAPTSDRAQPRVRPRLRSRARPCRGSHLEHIRVRDGILEVCGEGILARAGPLHLETGFFGADEALTSYAPGRDHWVATLMVTGPDLDEAWERREGVVEEIRSRCGIRSYRDESPPHPAGRRP